MLRRHSRCFLDSTEKYSYYTNQAAIAAARGNVHRAIEVLGRVDSDTLSSDEKTRLDLLRQIILHGWGITRKQCRSLGICPILRKNMYFKHP